MLKRGLFVLIAFVFSSTGFVWAQEYAAQELFSPSTAEMLIQFSDQLSIDAQDSSENAGQISVFLRAAKKLNPQLSVSLEQVVKLASMEPGHDFSDLIEYQLKELAPSESNIRPTLSAISYLIQNQNSREEKEVLLQSLLGRPGGYNDFLASEIALELGWLSAEKVDSETAANFFYQSWQLNPYNIAAFDQLFQLAPTAVSVADYGTQLRRELVVNPYNLNSALRYAQFAWTYEMAGVASKAYAYCADVFRYINPDKEIPVYIYLPWVKNAFAAKDQLQPLTDIVQLVRKQGTFDLRVESIYLLANSKGNGFEELGLKAQKINAEDPKKVSNLDLAWFYCFVHEDKAKALDFANKAYSDANDDPAIKSLFAYALLLNKQPDMTQELITDIVETDQVAALTNGLYLLEKDERADGLKFVKSAVSLDPASIIALKARDIITQQGSEYIPQSDPVVLANDIAKKFNGLIVPDFMMPEKVFDVDMNLGGNEFLYTSPIKASLTITNKSGSPMIVAPGALFNGIIRVDAVVTGDINAKFPAVILKEIRPGKVIDSGKGIFVALDIEQGAFAKLLKDHPQAECDITLTTYIDPVERDGKIVNNIESIKPVTALMKRNKVNLTSKYLMQRLDAFEKGRDGQKIHSAMLFAGLLSEQLKDTQTYRFKVTPKEILYSAFVRSLNNDPWTIKTYSTRYLADMDLSYDVVSALSQNLYDKNWPVRLMSVYVLASSKTQGFDQVLEWVEKSDSEPLVREMAAIMRQK